MSSRWWLAHPREAGELEVAETFLGDGGRVSVKVVAYREAPIPLCQPVVCWKMLRYALQRLQAKDGRWFLHNGDRSQRRRIPMFLTWVDSNLAEDLEPDLENFFED